MVAPLSANAATYYVAPTEATRRLPERSGPLCFLGARADGRRRGRHGLLSRRIYRYTDATATCTSTTATVNAVVLSKSGASGKPIRYWAYPGETPVFDFSGITDTNKYSCRQTGVRVEASWFYLKGLELKGTLQLNMDNHESWCVYIIGGSNNIFEHLDAHHNMGPGFFIEQGATTPS